MKNVKTITSFRLALQTNLNIYSLIDFELALFP